MEIEIILVNEEHAEILCGLGRKLFSETFSEYNTEENMKKYLDDSYQINIQKKELNDDCYKTFIAFDNGEPIGFSQIRKNKKVYDFIDDKEAIELLRIYVDKKYIGKGIGKMLINRCLEEIKNMEKQTVWLGVWEHNHIAINFYKRNGFYEVGNHIFKVGDQEDKDLIMIKKLTN
jgi:diamine N-acetyltransferase